MGFYEHHNLYIFYSQRSRDSNNVKPCDSLIRAVADEILSNMNLPVPINVDRTYILFNFSSMKPK